MSEAFLYYYHPMVRFVLAIVLLIATPVTAGDIMGSARVIDGDTLAIKSERIRFFGIDAPELDQTCEWPKKTIPCGEIVKTTWI